MPLSITRRWRRSVLLAAVAVAGTLPALFTPAAQPTTRPASQPTAPSQQEIDEAVRLLGARDFRERERASRVLWAVGEGVAGPALRRAAAGADPEVALRARKILSDFEFGLAPDTPVPVAELVARYRAGDPAVKQSVVGALAGQGERGVRVLLKLWGAEKARNPAMHAAIGAVLAQRAAETAAVLLADGQRDLAKELLAAACRNAQQADAPRHYAALLLLTNDLDQGIAAARTRDLAADTPNASQSANRLLAYLCRAKGDSATALDAARRANDGDLIYALQVEAGRWADLAEMAAQMKAAGPGERIGAPGSAERFAYLAAFCRLAGDNAGRDRWLDRLAALGADGKDAQAWPCAEALMLNGRAAQGVDLLLSRGDYATAIDFMVPMLRLKEGRALPARAKAAAAAGASSWDLPLLQVKAAKVVRFADGPKRAGEVLEQVAREQDDAARKPSGAPPWRPAVFAELARTARGVVPGAQADGYLVTALSAATERGAAEQLLRESGLGERAAQWWPVVRERFPREPVARSLARLRAIDKGQVPADELAQLARDAAEAAKRLPMPERAARLELLGDTLVDAGLTVAAERLAEAAQVPNLLSPARDLRRADLAAKSKRWDWAAELYGRVWERDRTQPLPLLLRGRALLAQGKEADGNAAVELAHLLPLGDGSKRHAFMLQLSERGLTDDARRERDLIRRTATPGSWELTDATRRAGDEANARGDWANAVDLWERAFLDNMSPLTGFVEPWANVAMPALIARTRALALLDAGDVGGAMRQAETSMNSFPAEADHLIELVNALDKHGHKPEADDLFARWTKRYRDVLADFPESGSAHNMLAWAQAKTHRELDDALSHAKRAVELEPANTASIDTLAVTYFARGEVAPAVEAMRRCVELEPADKRHREQLERFEKALGGYDKKK